MTEQAERAQKRRDLLEKAQRSPSYKYTVLAITAIGIFMSTLDGSIVNVALPTISTAFSASLTTLGWVVTAYLLAISSLLPTMGRAADLYGRKAVYSLGFIVFIIGSALCGLSWNVGALIIFRVIQAIGAAMLMANGMAIVTAVFPAKERGRALGISGTVVAAGSLTGPALGGLIVGALNWRYIFYINLPIGIIGALLGFTLLPEQPRSHEGRFDFLGSGLFVIGLVPLLLALSEGQDIGWGSPIVYVMLVLAVAGLTAFYYVERRTAQPMVDLSLFRQPIFTIGNAAGMLSYTVNFFSVFLIPFYLTQVRGLPPELVGLMMTPVPAVMFFVAPLSGWLSDRIGYVFLTSAGMIILTLGMVALSGLKEATGFVSVALRLALVGIGMGLFTSPNNSSIMGAVHTSKLGLTSGLIATVRNVGMMLGVAISASLFQNRLGHAEAYLQARFGPLTPALENQAFVTSLHTTFLIAAGIGVLGIIISSVRAAEGPRPQPR